MNLDFQLPHGPELLVSRMAGGLIGSEILKIAGEIRAMKTQGKQVLDLTVGDFSPSQFRIPKGLEQRIGAALERGETNYPPSNGVIQLREAVTRLYLREFDLNYALPSVIIAGGARPLIYATYRAVLNPGDTVVYAVPSWNNNHYAHLLGARTVAIPTRSEARFLPEADQLKRHLADARLLCLCSPLNPTGTAFQAEALEGICNLVLAENQRRGPSKPPLYVMYDQVYWMLTFGDVRHFNPVTLCPEMAPYTIFVDGISKAFAATGVRVGWGLGPPAVIQRMSDILGHVGAWAPRAEQAAVADYLDDVESMTSFRREFSASVQARLVALHRGIDKLKAEGLPVRAIEPMGAIYLTVQFDAVGRRTPEGRVLESNEAIRKDLLERAQLAVVPFQSFAMEGDSGWFRCSVGAVSVEEIHAAIPRIGATLKSLR